MIKPFRILTGLFAALLMSSFSSNLNDDLMVVSYDMSTAADTFETEDRKPSLLADSQQNSGENRYKAGNKMALHNIAFRQGLSNLQVNSICQDASGYIWVGTARGLNRYDGVEMKHFFFSPTDQHTISEDFVNQVMPGNENRLYILTGGKVSVYDSRKESITRLNQQQVRIENIAAWHDQLYLGSSTGQLFHLNDDDLTIQPVKDFPDSLHLVSQFQDETKGLIIHVILPNKLPGLIIYDPESAGVVSFMDIHGHAGMHDLMVHDAERINNQIWIGSDKGLFIYDEPKGVFLRHWLQNTFDTQDIRFIRKRAETEIWIGTYHEGLFIYHTDTDKLVHHKTTLQGYDSDMQKELLTDLLIDHQQNAWIGTFNNGLEVYYSFKRQFNHDEKLNHLSRGKFITSILRTSKGYLLLGSRESGLTMYHPSSQETFQFSRQNSALKSNFVCKLFEDTHGNIWIGQQNELQKFDPVNKSFKQIPTPAGINEILYFTETTNGQIFIATDKAGLLMFDPGTGNTTEYKQMGTNIRQISVYNDDELLVCSFSQGLFLFNIHSGKIRKIGPHIDLPAWTEAQFLTYFLDNDQIFWVGSLKWGLIRYNPANDSIRVYDRSDGLPGNDVVGIVQDENGFLWLSTLFGLSRHDKKDAFFNLSFADGIENQQFHQNSTCFDGENLYFGGNYGLTHFRAEQFTQQVMEAPEIILRSLFVNYHEISPADDSNVLDQSLAFTRSIRLTHRQRSFSIDFVAFDYAEAEKISYAYMLEGFDKNWIHAGHARRAVYSNLRPGMYTFQVKAKNSESVYSEAATLQIRVLQSPWLGFWAISTYVLLILLIIITIFRLSLKAKLYKKEKEMEQSERQRESEIHAMKLKFFSDISHEFRTPLTVISGTSTLISKQIEHPGQLNDLFRSLQQNVDRLLKLINQLLTFKELEGGNLNLAISCNNPNEHIGQICKSFVYYARMKQLSMITDINIREGEIYYDTDIFEKILSNLISNAIKFTPAEGMVKIQAITISRVTALAKYPNLGRDQSNLSASGYLEVSVSDSGTGIKKKHLETIFERYKQIGKGSRKDYSGSGIGLDFVKRLALIHKGDIMVKSTFGQGSVFSFILPLDQKLFSPEQFINDTKETMITETVRNDELPLTANNQPARPVSTNKIAVVEDNLELCQLLVNAFSSRYAVISAHDGESALKLIRKEKPDMVISDVVMPGIDGIRLCQAIKSDPDLLHIIVVLLSKKSEMTDQIEGIRKGADVYIPKPFSLDFIMATIERQFENREKLHKIYLGGLMPNLKQTDANAEVMHFLSAFNALLEKNIADVDLSVDILADKMNMGRSSFYKTFVRITSITPNAYIAKYRINKSVELLKQNRYSLSEISDMIGFRSASYFSTTFKKEKGVSPRDYCRDHLARKQ